MLAHQGTPCARRYADLSMQRGDWQQGARRLRWRLRGAWQWPAFLALTVADAIVLALLPFYEPGPGGLFPALLVAGFANLIAVAVAAPLLGRVVRARRPDLPRVVARDYAGTLVLLAFTALAVAGGVLHRSAAEAADAKLRAVRLSLHDYVLRQAPELRGRLGAMDARQLEPDYYRACVPKLQPRRWLCLFVSTGQQPPGIRRDSDELSNAASDQPPGG
jgi:4-amino-4-deoxy-L-arabinose transferase-like glycosyltransferase